MKSGGSLTDATTQVVSEAREVIAAVLHAHRIWDEAENDAIRCHCDLTHPHMTFGVPDGGWMPPDAYRDHVAAEIDTALGRLVRDLRRVNPKPRGKPCDSCGHLKGIHGTPCRMCGRCDEYRYTEPTTSWEGRWVGGWTPQEDWPNE